jgi:hypothetical protein
MISELLDWLAVQLAIWTICRPPWQLRSAAAGSIAPAFHAKSTCCGWVLIDPCLKWPQSEVMFLHQIKVSFYARGIASA